MQIYLSGPMKGKRASNYPAFDSAAEYLRRLGHFVWNPSEADRDLGLDPNGEACWEDLLKRDIHAITDDLDAMAFLPGWENSKGARFERDVADRLGFSFWRVDGHKEQLTPELLVGVAGYARVGKDTAADYFERRGWDRVGFASKIREVLYALNPIIWAAPDGLGDDHSRTNKSITRVAEMVDRDGWVDAKAIPEVRQLLQRLGAEGARNALGEDVWVQAALNCPPPRLVLTDVRFPNEVEAIQRRGGVVVRITRPGYCPINGHLSETALDTTILPVVENTGTEEELGEKVWNLAQKHFTDRAMIPERSGFQRSQTTSSSSKLPLGCEPPLPTT